MEDPLSTLFPNLSSWLLGTDHTTSMKQHGPLLLRRMALLVLHQVTKAQIIQEESSCILFPKHLLSGNTGDRKIGKMDLAFKHNYNGILWDWNEEAFTSVTCVLQLLFSTSVHVYELLLKFSNGDKHQLKSLSLPFSIGILTEHTKNHFNPVSNLLYSFTQLKSHFPDCKTGKTLVHSCKY